VQQPYSLLEEELHEVFVLAKGLDLSGTKHDLDLRKAIAEFLSPMAPFPANAQENGPPSFTSVEYLAFDNHSNPNKFEKKAIVTILGTHKGYGNFTSEIFVEILRFYDSRTKMDHLFSHLSLDLWNLICNPLGLFGAARRSS